MDSIEEIYLDRKTVFGNTQSNYDIDLMRGIIINVRTMDGIEDSKRKKNEYIFEIIAISKYVFGFFNFTSVSRIQY